MQKALHFIGDICIHEKPQRDKKAGGELVVYETSIVSLQRVGAV
jgi:hypothetical protein